METLNYLSTDSRIVIMAEPVSNLHQNASISNPEIIFNSKTNYPDKAIPELVIYLGGQVVSKKIKLFLRGLKKALFYRISTDEQIIDTFQNVNTIIKADPYSVLKGLKVKNPAGISDFKNFWQNETRKAKRLSEKYTGKIEYSDLLVFKKISELLPDDAIVFAGNSSVVRYLDLF